MIYKSFLISLTLFLVYLIISPLLPKNQYLTIWQDNLVKTQRYLYDSPDSIKNVIVGTSLSSRLKMDSLKGFYNLSLRGLSLFDGLAVISKRTQQPSCVLIEINYPLKEEDLDFQSSINSVFFSTMWKNIPVLREEYTPAVLLVLWITKWIPGKWWRVPVKEEFSIRKPKSDLFYLQIARRISDLRTQPSQALLSEKFSHLKEIILRMEKNGTKVIFFEMPVDKNLCDLRTPRTIRQFFEYYLPPNQYKLIFSEDCAAYNTTDGVHLSSQSAIKFTSRLKKIAALP